MLISHHTAGGLSILQETFLELEPTSSYLLCRCWSSTSLPWPTLSYPIVPQLSSSYTRSSLSYPIEPHPSSSYPVLHFPTPSYLSGYHPTQSYPTPLYHSLPRPTHPTPSFPTLTYPIEPQSTWSFSRAYCQPTLSYTFLHHPTCQATSLPSPTSANPSVH